MNSEDDDIKHESTAPGTPPSRRSQRVLALAIGSFFAALLANPAFHVLDTYWPKRAHSYGYVEHDPRDPIVIERWESIHEELATLDLPEWAGTYESGGPYQIRALSVAPASGFAFTDFGCLGLYAQNSGDVRAEGARIYLDAELSGDPGHSPEIQSEFIFVAWGDRKYLVAPDQMIAFVNDVRWSLEYRKWAAFDYYEFISVDGPVPEELPDVPSEFADAFSAPGLRARVIEILSSDAGEVGPRDYHEVRMRLDLGRERGAYTGLQLAPSDPYVGYMVARLVEVDANSSVAEILVSPDVMPPDVQWVFVPMR